MMIEARLRVRHPGCLAEILPPGARLTQLSSDGGGGLFHLSADPLAPVLERFARDARFRVRIVRRETTSALVRLIGALPCPHADASGVALYPLSFANGCERGRHVFASAHDLRAFVGRDPRARIDVETTGIAQLEAHDDAVPLSGLLSALTQKQLDVMRTAVEGGYYEIPRAVTTAALAEHFSITRTTYDEHLRKAEQTLLRQIVALVAAQPQLTLAARKRRGGARPAALVHHAPAHLAERARAAAESI